MSRRSLVCGGAAAAAMTLSGCAANHDDAAPIALGIQLYTLGEEAAADAPGALRGVAEIGYREVELPSLYNQSGAALRQAIDAAGLTCPSLHAPLETQAPGMLSLADTPRVIAEAKALGATFVTVPIFPFPASGARAEGETIPQMLERIARGMSAADWGRLADKLNEKGALIAREGLHLCYHNHNLEFVPIEGGAAMDVLIERTDPALVSFEIDTGWVAAAGFDPAAFLARHRGRIRLLHVKDLTETRPNFGLFMNPTEAGAGIIDWPSVLAAARAAGVRHYFIEQEPPFARPRLEAARIGYENIKGVFETLRRV